MSHKNPKIYKVKYYPHFDAKIHWRSVKSQVEDEHYVSHHAFYPFIHYKQVMHKFPKKFVGNSAIEMRDKPKERDIMYSAHVDRYIYEYYAYKLNMIYNRYLQEHGLGKCAIAYRTNLHKNNIHFAKEAFDRIRSQKDCLVVIGDFTKYFDKIDHAYLKQSLCNLLSVATLPDDHYAIFRSITKYAWMELSEIRKYKNLKRKEFNNLDRIFTPDEFRSFKKEHLHKNLNNFGIPQGSAISAVYSNIYLTDFDLQMNNLCRNYNGFYRRYCDDFIVVLPYNADLNQHYIDAIFQIKNRVKNLELEPQKTQLLHYNEGTITSVNECYLTDVPNGNNLISYLGFTFDGSQVRIRSKTIAKYYERMYSKADNIVKAEHFLPDGKRISKRKIYRLYSYKGKATASRDPKQGNFLSYVDRAAEIFSNEPIEQDTKHSWDKLHLVTVYYPLNMLNSVY